MATLAALISALAAALCFHARADSLGSAFALAAVILALNAAQQWRQASAAARQKKRQAPFVRPALPTDDTY